MHRTEIFAIPILVTSLVLSSCGTAESPSLERTASSKAQITATSVGVFESYWPKRTVTDLGQRLAVIAGILTNVTPPDTATYEAIVSRHQADVARWIDADSSHGNRLSIVYDPTRDDLHATNLDVEENRAVSVMLDIGENAAKAAVANVLNQLSNAQVIVASRYNIASAEISHTMHGMSLSTEQPAPQVLQYRYLLRRQINGIDFAHNGVSIVVHRNGAIANIRVGGAEIRSSSAGTAETPVGSGSTFVPMVTASDVAARFAAELPDARGVKSSLMYVFPNGLDSGMIEPRYVYRYSRSYTAPDGTVSLAKARLVAYSLHNPADASTLIAGAPNRPSNWGATKP